MRENALVQPRFVCSKQRQFRIEALSLSLELELLLAERLADSGNLGPAGCGLTVWMCTVGGAVTA